MRSGTNEDKHRTASGELQVGPFALGFELITGEPDRLNPSKPNYWEEEEGANAPRAGRIYGSFLGARFGWNSEKIRRGLQHTVHDVLNYPYFKTQNDPDSFYWRGGTSLWY